MTIFWRDHRITICWSVLIGTAAMFCRAVEAFV